MDFSVEFYETKTGSSPVRKFLRDLKQSDPNDFAAIVSGLGRMQNRENHHPPLSKPLGNGLHEIRHVGKLNTRVLFFFMSGRRIIAVHGIRNKSQKIPDRDLQAAISRMNDWIERNGR